MSIEDESGDDSSNRGKKITKEDARKIRDRFDVPEDVAIPDGADETVKSRRTGGGMWRGVNEAINEAKGEAATPGKQRHSNPVIKPSSDG